MRKGRTTKMHLAELAEFRARIKQALAGGGTPKEAEALAGLTKLLPFYLKIVELERELADAGRPREAVKTAQGDKRQVKNGYALSEGEWNLLAEIIQSRDAGEKA